MQYLKGTLPTSLESLHFAGNGPRGGFTNDFDKNDNLIDDLMRHNEVMTWHHQTLK